MSALKCLEQPSGFHLAGRESARGLIRRRRWLRQLGLSCHRSWARGDGQMSGAEFFDVWEFVEIAQAEMIEKELRRLVQQRAAGDFGAPGDLDQSAFH